MSVAASASGLDDVVAAATEMSDVDGQAGRLVIRGHSVEELVASQTFEDVAALMWNGALPDTQTRDGVRQALARGRAEAFRMLLNHAMCIERSEALGAVLSEVLCLGLVCCCWIFVPQLAEEQKRDPN